MRFERRKPRSTSSRLSSVAARPIWRFGHGYRRDPEQFAVILILEQLGDFGLRQLRELIMDRIRAFPRLRQRLIKVPFGCGSGLGR